MAKTPSASGIVSLRLTPEERQLVEEAAAKKGWKTAKFLRASALERAAHVLNLSRPTSFDFSGIARRAAEALATPRDVELVDVAGELVGHFGVGPIDYSKYATGEVDLNDVVVRKIGPDAFARGEIEKLSQAVRLGGLDFAEQLVIECRRLVSDASDPNLPAPIDPFKPEGQDTD